MLSPIAVLDANKAAATDPAAHAITAALTATNEAAVIDTAV